VARIRVVTRIKVDSDEAKERLDDMGDRTRDMGPVLRWAKNKLEESNRENFLSSGSMSARAMLGGAWPPLSADYGAWKATHWATPLMIRTGKLLFDATNLDVIGNSDQSITLTVNNRIAKFHQYGTENMPARPILFTPRDFDRDLGRLARKYIKHGSKLT
jgi:phage gpG-like protein